MSIVFHVIRCIVRTEGRKNQRSAGFQNTSGKANCDTTSPVLMNWHAKRFCAKNGDQTLSWPIMIPCSV